MWGSTFDAARFAHLSAEDTSWGAWSEKYVPPAPDRHQGDVKATEGVCHYIVSTLDVANGGSIFLYKEAPPHHTFAIKTIESKILRSV